MEIESQTKSSYGSSHQGALTRWRRERKGGSGTSKFKEVNNQTTKLSSQGSNYQAATSFSLN